MTLFAFSKSVIAERRRRKDKKHDTGAPGDDISFILICGHKGQEQCFQKYLLADQASNCWDGVGLNILEVEVPSC